MTRYILAGGCDLLYPDYLTQLARVIHSTIEQPHVLSCWFSNSEDDANEKFPEYKEYFLSFFNEGTEFIKASKTNFLDEIERADVVYFHGGHTSLLLTAMQAYGDLKDSFEGKIIIGSSAGVNYISNYGFSPRSAETSHGAGLVDVSTIVHFGSKGFAGMSFDQSFWENAAKKVKANSQSNNVLLLPEGTFAVFDS